MDRAVCVCGIEGVVGWRGGRLRPLRQQPLPITALGSGLRRVVICKRDL